MIDVKELEPLAAEDEATWTELWTKAGEAPLTQDEAERALACLWRRTHLWIAQHMPGYVADFPTCKRYPGILKARRDLYWTDHGTEGLTHEGTLAWFSSRRWPVDDPATGKPLLGPDGKPALKLQGGSTHFVIALDGTVFYLIDLADGAWHEPKRNRDSWSVEMVNALDLHQENGKWRTWCGRYPYVESYPPVELTPPWRNTRFMQPYDARQVGANIKLKRLVMAAQPGRLAPERMSQHSDWRTDKLDCGPLWPIAEINAAAFSTTPVDGLDWVKALPAAGPLPTCLESTDAPAVSAREGDLAALADPVPSLREVQKTLLTLGYALPRFGADGQLGAETAAAVRAFQADWNQAHPADAIGVDGIPGAETEKRLAAACAERGATP